MICTMFTDKYRALREADDELLNDIFGPEQSSVQSSMSQLSVGSGGQLSQQSHSGFLPADLLESSDLITQQG